MERPSPDLLLTHAAWLRRLALALTRDEDDADDLVQETWIAALRSPPDPGRPRRPWLAEVLRNVDRMRRRGAARRVARELASELTPAAAPGPEHLVERAQLSRQLVDLVLELDEPYRGTVLLRYFEDLDATQIAALHDVPAGTVRWRLSEALARVRHRLDESAGGRRAWLPVLATLPRGVLAVQKGKSLGLGIVALVLLLLAGGGWLTWRQVRAPEDAAAGAARTDATRAGRTAGASASPTAEEDGAAPAADWAVQPGVRARPLSGRVLYLGAPVAGAEVVLADWVSAARGAPEASVKSDADGRFVFAPRKAWQYIVTASAPGHAAAARKVDNRVPAPAEIVLELGDCAFTVVGVVSDASGTGLAGASVREALARMPGPLGPAVTTDEGGHYRLCVRRGEVTLGVAAPGYGSAIATTYASGEQRLDVVLSPEGNVVGTTVDAATGAPVGGVQVNLWPPQRGAGSADTATTTSDAAGHFELAGVGAGRFFLGAWAGEHVFVEAQEVAVESGAVTGPITVRLVRGVRVSGVVRAGGRPLPGALVTLVTTDAAHPGGAGAFVRSHATVTQEAGDFVSAPAPLGSTVTLEVQGYEVRSPRTLRVERARLDGVDVEVVALPHLAGRVVQGGKPVAGARVLAVASAAPASGGAALQTISEADGRFDLAVPAPGDFHVMAQSADAFSTHEALVHAPTDDAEIDLDAGGAIAGVVVDAAGQPVVGAAVRFQRSVGDDRGDAVTGVTGGFEITALAGAGDYRAEVRAFPGAPGVLPLAPGTPLVHLADARARADGLRLVVVRAERTIAGHVVDEHGQPVPDVLVRAAPMDGAQVPELGAGTPWPSARSEVDGHFAIAVSDEGRFALQAQAGRGATATLAGIAAGRTDVVLRITSPGRVEGTLAGLPQAAVWARRVGGSTYVASSFMGHVEGARYHLDGLAPGSYLVQALAAGGRAAAARVEVRAGQTATLDLRSAGTATLHGRVLDFVDGTPVAELRCAVSASAGDEVPPLGLSANPLATAVSAADGRFEIGNAPVGDAVVRCTGDPARVASGLARVRVTEDGAATTDVLVVVRQRGERPGSAGLRLGGLQTIAVVTAVHAGSAAAAAGVRAGDRVVAVDGRSVAALGPDSILWLIGDRAQGQPVRVTFARGTETSVRVLTIGPPWDE